MAGYTHPISGTKPSRTSGGEVSPDEADASAREQSVALLADMIALLSCNAHGPDAQTLARLRQLYPHYPLTLRLAALVAGSEMNLGGKGWLRDLQ